MDGGVRVLRPFNSISVISRRWEDEHERLCAVKRRLGSGRISPPAGFEPATPWSDILLERIMHETLDDHERSVSIGGRLITNFRFAGNIVVNDVEKEEADVLHRQFRYNLNKVQNWDRSGPDKGDNKKPKWLPKKY